MTKRVGSGTTKKYLLKECEKLGISVPKSATEMRLESELFRYYYDAAIIHTENGLAARQTGKLTSEYKIDFTIYASRIIRAESEEAAIEWIKEEVSDCYMPVVGTLEHSSFDEIIDVHKYDDEVQ